MTSLGPPYVMGLSGYGHPQNLLVVCCVDIDRAEDYFCGVGDPVVDSQPVNREREREEERERERERVLSHVTLQPARTLQ